MLCFVVNHGLEVELVAAEEVFVQILHVVVPLVCHLALVLCLLLHGDCLVTENRDILDVS